MYLLEVELSQTKCSYDEIVHQKQLLEQKVANLQTEIEEGLGNEVLKLK